MDFYDTLTANEIIDRANQILLWMAEYYQPGRLPCGYLTLRSAWDGRVLLVARLGECPAEKDASYRRNSMEKGERLFAHPDHVSSWQSRDPEKQRWGGAIRVGDVIVSFSGLPEHADEALCAALAKSFGWLLKEDFEQARAIFEISKNEKGLEAFRMAA